MRKLWIAVFLIGCGSSSPTTPQPLVDGGVDGGGGLDGGSCENTIVEQPLDPNISPHLPETETPIYQSNPPVQGPHYARWAIWQRYTQTVPRGFWVHNLEHGGVVFLYRPDAPQDLINALIRVYDAIPPGIDNNGCALHRRAVLTPDPLLDAPWAVTVSGPEAPPGIGYYIKASCIRSEQTLIDFALQHRGRAREDNCDQGTYP